MDKKEIVLFIDGNVALEVPITPEQDAVWLNRNQMAELFERDRRIAQRISMGKICLHCC